jgi:hypothetical protein
MWWKCLSADFYFAEAGGVGGGAGHAAGGVVHDDGAVGGDGDEAAVVGIEGFVKHFVHGVFQRLLEIGHAGGNVEADSVANVLLAEAGAADGAGRVVGIRPGSDNRRIPHAAVLFVRAAAGGGARGEVAVRIERDAADCAVVEVGGADVGLSAPSPVLSSASPC